MKNYWSLLILVSSIGYADVISTPGKAIVVGNSAGSALKRVCYYQDQAYSVGAILQVGEHYMICGEENRHESNGALRWSPLDKKQPEPNSQPSYKVN